MRHCIRMVVGLVAAGMLALAIGCGGGNGGENGGESPSTSGAGAAVQIRTNIDDYAFGAASDSAGNLYVGGIVGNALAGQSNAGRSDAFVIKYDTNYATLWTHQFGTDNNETVRDVALDSGGNVYAVGETFGTFPGFETEYFGADAFVRAIDSAGAERWTKQFGTTVGTFLTSVVVDASGNVYVAGYTEGSLPGFTNGGGPTVGAVSNWNDGVIRKYDAAGNELWTRQFGGEGHDEIHGVTLDAAGNLLVVGYTDGQFEGSTNTGGRDAFVRRYDPEGNASWTAQFGSESASGSQPNDKGLGIAVDAQGNMLVVGETFGAMPGQEYGGGGDAFVSKLDQSGQVVWVRQFGGEDDDSADAVVLDGQGNVFVAGNTEGTIPDGKSNGIDDGFVKSFDANGGVRWTRQFGTGRIDTAHGAVIASGNLYVVGGTEGLMDETLTGKITGFTESDGYLLRMSLE